jgi:hypothetical protein
VTLLDGSIIFRQARRGGRLEEDEEEEEEMGREPK